MSPIDPQAPEPGTPEFLELVRQTKQRIWEETGVWVDAVDIGADPARDRSRQQGDD